MQCAARSAPQLRSAPRSRARIELRADESVDAARKRLLVERVEARERAEAGRAGRLDGRAQALDDARRRSPARRRRPRSCGLAPQTMEHTTGFGRGRRPGPGDIPGTWPAGLDEPLAVQLGASVRAVGGSARRSRRPHRVAARQLEAEDLGQRPRLACPGRRPSAGAPPDGAPSGLASSSSSQSRGGCSSTR